MHVAIVGLGPSANQYLEVTKSLGGKEKLCDEVWCINALGSVFQCDKIFHMDDVRIQEVRAQAAPKSNIAAMIEWMKETSIPIITSRKHKDYPSLVEFPLAKAIKELKFAYFNSTAAYAIVYAILLRVEKITLFGMDFTYPNSHDAEKGRACVEFWLGIASQKGIKIGLPRTTSLMDSCMAQQDRLYGYDTLNVEFDENGKVKLTPHENLPTAEEIEERYDHSVHPNPLVQS